MANDYKIDIPSDPLPSDMEWVQDENGEWYAEFKSLELSEAAIKKMKELIDNPKPPTQALIDAVKRRNEDE